MAYQEKSSKSLDYRYILQNGNDASCKYLVGCEVSKCNKCRKRTKDQIVKILD